MTVTIFVQCDSDGTEVKWNTNDRGMIQVSLPEGWQSFVVSGRLVDVCPQCLAKVFPALKAEEAPDAS